ncbi:ATP-binding cassette domain-containing protein [Sulfurimonas sp. HSL1-2]|uniref:ABC transporter ATP-binding protein n=1 Tax=Thiomicrolovo zhangzhouensis TaxID=3131933 RepID=UPI0031F78A6F
MRPVIEVEKVVTRFGERLVHDEVSLHINAGEIYGFLGPSGCGKSTLMREIILLEPLQSGTIRLFGEPLNTLSFEAAQALRRKWGVLFQSNALFTSLNVAENISVMLREYTALPAGVIDEIVAFKLDIVGLTPKEGKLYPSQLSGGMKKKVALARALALDPPLLFLDEPTSGLDPVSAREFDALILKLRDMLQLTVVMVTHDLASIETVLDRMAIIDERRIAAEGTLSEVKRVASPFIRTFFGGDVS